MAQARARTTAAKPRKAQDLIPAPTYERVLAAALGRAGATVIDAGGIARLDAIAGWGSTLLGWNDPDVEAAVARGGSHARLESRIAEIIAGLCPAAEAVAFRASAPRALADALSAAKDATGREGAFFCEDDAVACDDVSTVESALDRYSGLVAAVVIEPMDAGASMLRALRRLCDRHGAVLVFDETKSALRSHLGGIQGATGVAPDLAVWGPAIANGRPLAAVSGRMELLRALPPVGSPVSDAALAAACAALEKAVAVDLPARLRETGSAIAEGVEARIGSAGLETVYAVCGDPVWSVVTVRPDAPGSSKAFRDALSSTLFEAGVLSYGSHAPCLAFGEAETERLMSAWDQAAAALSRAVASGAFERRSRPRSRAS